MRLTSVPALSFLVMSWVRVTVTVIPCFKKDIVTFRLIGVGIAFQDQHRHQLALIDAIGAALDWSCLSRWVD